jgi:hypothetical protein
MNATHDTNDHDSLELQAKKRVDAKLGFLTHLLVFCCVNAGFYLLGVVSGREWHFGHAPFPIWGWGLGLFIHGVVTWASLQGMDLRSRLMAQELEQLRRRPQL